MPRFYFHLCNDIIAEDEEGVELRDVEAAREHAIEEARVMVCESIKKGHLNLEHRIAVTDEAGAEVLDVSFRDAFTIEG
jgi:hypothetical protein